MPTLASLLFKPISGAFSMGRAVVGGGVGMQIGGGIAIGAVAGAAGGYDINSAVEGAAKGAIFGAIGGGLFAGVRRGAGPAAKKAGNWMINSGGFDRRAALKSQISSPVGPKMKGGQFFTNMPIGWGKDMSFVEQAKGSGIAKIGRAAGRAGGSTARGSARVAAFVMEHPVAIGSAIGVAAGGAALYSVANRTSIQQMESPTLTGVDISPNYNQQAIMAAEMGPIGGGLIGSAQQMEGQFEYANWMKQVGSMKDNSSSGRMAQSTSGLVQGLNAGRHG